MILALAALLLIGLLAGGAGLCFYGARYAWVNEQDKVLSAVTAAGGVFFTIVLLLILALATGEVKIEDIPDGCYQVVSDMDTTFMPGANGTVVPITYNDRHYLPIRCP